MYCMIRILCTSSGRRKTTTPSCGWVAFHTLPLLMKKPNMGAKELQDTLQRVHNVTIGYDTVWKGKEKALEELFGSWEESFKLLFSWREAVLAKEPDSIVEIDVVLEDGKYYFNRFFCALAPDLLTRIRPLGPQYLKGWSLQHLKGDDEGPNQEIYSPDLLHTQLKFSRGSGR
jgi:hypothetical protein